MSENATSIPFWDNLFRSRHDWKYEAVRLLADTPIFSVVPKRVLRSLVDGMYHRHYQNGEAVFNAGDPGLGMYLVLSGTVAIQLNKRKLAELKKGDFFGEVALFGEELRTADAIADEQCELLGFFRPDLQEWVERNPKLGVKVLLQLGKVLAERLRSTNQRLIATQES